MIGRLTGYTRLRHLGAGATGTVDLARHDATGTLVAIKELSPDLRWDAAFLERFRMEAAVLGRLRHPNIAALYDYVEGDVAAIVLEYIDGASLRRVLETRGAMSTEAALLVLRGSLWGLAATHAVGIVHRDYKPENVLVDTVGESRLIDFGIAQRQGETGWRAGTPAYMAPEQWQAGVATPQTDVYAATAVLVECLTGTAPYGDGDRTALRLAHLHAPIPDAGLAPQLRTLVRRGLAKRAEERYSSAQEFAAELEQAAVVACGEGWDRRGAQALTGALVSVAQALPWLLGGASFAAASGVVVEQVGAAASVAGAAHATPAARALVPSAGGHAAASAGLPVALSAGPTAVTAAEAQASWAGGQGGREPSPGAEVGRTLPGPSTTAPAQAVPPASGSAASTALSSRRPQGPAGASLGPRPQLPRPRLLPLASIRFRRPSLGLRPLTLAALKRPLAAVVAAGALLAAGAVVGTPAAGPGAVARPFNVAHASQCPSQDAMLPSIPGVLTMANVRLRAGAGVAVKVCPTPAPPKQAGELSTEELAAAVNCDCPHVDNGFLTGPYQRACRDREKALRNLAATGQLHLTVVNHKITDGDVCGESGPNAWPVVGQSDTPPRPDESPGCVYVGGLVQYQCPSDASAVVIPRDGSRGSPPTPVGTGLPVEA